MGYHPVRKSGSRQAAEHYCLQIEEVSDTHAIVIQTIGSARVEWRVLEEVQRGCIIASCTSDSNVVSQLSLETNQKLRSAVHKKAKDAIREQQDAIAILVRLRYRSWSPEDPWIARRDHELPDP